MQFSILFITFILQFRSAFASPTDPWQLVGEVGATSFPGQNNEKGYECGNDFFSDSKVEEALTMYLQRMNQAHHSPLAYHSHQGYPNFQQNHNGPQRHIVPRGYNSPQRHNNPQEDDDFDVLQYLDLSGYNDPPENNIPQNIQQYFTPELYKGPLYSDSESSNYILWPIQKEKIFHSSTKYSNDPYYIVIKKNDGKVIDIISRTINNSHTKCIRIDGPTTGLPTSFPDMYNGYQCAHEFLGDELIRASLRLLWDKSGITSKYPKSYVGRLYPASSGYKIWPILYRGGLFDDNSVGPYFLVIDGQGNFIETVVQGLSNNFLRCTRSRGFSETPPPNAPNHSSKRVSKVHHGYYCGMFFFHEDAVMQAAKKAKTATKKRALKKKYYGHPFYQELLLWPLMHDGNFYKTGKLGMYRVVLTKDFQFMCVAIMNDQKLQLCEQGIMKENKDHEKSDYQCVDHIVSNHDLIKAADEACSLKTRKDRFYPAKYVGPSFDKSGPYFTHPVLKGEKFSILIKDRVVVNSNCEVVGAITTIPHKYSVRGSKKFVLCMKLNEASTAKTYIEPDVPISEQGRGYMKLGKT